MKATNRRYPREHADFPVTVYWEDEAARVCPARVRDTSQGGVCLESAQSISIGTHVYMDLSSRNGNPIEAIVRYAAAHESGFRIGMEFTEESKQSAQVAVGETDYYEIMQLSPRADLQTINRVYRIMATRYHPDNRESGDQEKFLLLSERS